MINKSKIILPSDDDELKLVLSKACDLYSKAERSSVSFYTKFITPGEAMTIISRFPKGEPYLRLYGGYEDAERCICAFYTYEDELDFPICALKIRVKSKTAALGHRDYMGSVLGLGIKRETIGDIIVTDDGAVIFCLDEIADFIADNLGKVASIGVDTEKMASAKDISVSRKYSEISSTVSSLRCDAVIASATNLARGKAASLIERGYVNVNYNEVTQVSLGMKDGDVFSVRGYGKFKLLSDGHLTKKGRIHINLLKYI